MDLKKQRPDSPFFFEKEQVISLLRLRMSIFNAFVLLYSTIMGVVLPVYPSKKKSFERPDYLYIVEGKRINGKPTPDLFSDFRACKEITCSMNFKKQRPNLPFFFEKEQVISLLRLSMVGEIFCFIINMKYLEEQEEQMSTDYKLLGGLKWVQLVFTTSRRQENWTMWTQ